MAISPVDGRYASKTRVLGDYYSEFALIKYRLLVEIEYFIALEELAGIPQVKLNQKQKKGLRDIVKHFDPKEAAAIKKIEEKTNHDVKAVEYYLKKKMEPLGLSKALEFIHFGLTSQDINNTAIPMAHKDALESVLLPAYEDLVNAIKNMAKGWKNIPMLARTHGQPASPTRLGKEFSVFAERLSGQIKLLKAVPHAAKFGGATGNFNAHHAAYPDTNWHGFAKEFVEKRLGLTRSHPTTQIEHYDHLAAQADGLKRLNTILIDFCRDIWQYISLNYFTQNVIKGEVGSSAMPHKVNPIDYENAEGNLGLANAIFEHLSAKLPISRLQRDLTDSTVLRNLGVPMAHTLISLSSISKGISKLQLNQKALAADLEANWAVVAEGIQTILRREGYPEPYEALKALTRGNQAINKERIAEFITNLKVSPAVKKELLSLSPGTYLGK